MTRAFYKDIVCFCTTFTTNTFSAMKRNRKKTVTAEYYVFRFFAFKPPVYLDLW